MIDPWTAILSPLINIIHLPFINKVIRITATGEGLQKNGLAQIFSLPLSPLFSRQSHTHSSASSYFGTLVVTSQC